MCIVVHPAGYARTRYPKATGQWCPGRNHIRLLDIPIRPRSRPTINCDSIYTSLRTTEHQTYLVIIRSSPSWLSYSSAHVQLHRCRNDNMGHDFEDYARGRRDSRSVSGFDCHGCWCRTLCWDQFRGVRTTPWYPDASWSKQCSPETRVWRSGGCGRPLSLQRLTLIVFLQVRYLRL